MSSDHTDGRTLRFFFHFNNENALSRKLALLKHEMNKRGFTFESIQWWPVIKLFTLIQGYLYLISLEIIVGFRKLRSLQRTQINLKVLLEKPYIKYPSRN